MPPDENLPDFVVDGPSPTYDLTTTTLWEELRSAVNLVVNDQDYERQLQVACDLLLRRIRAAVGRYAAGYLVRVNLFVDKHGTIAIPGGELLTPIGLGREPIDALAEFYRMPATAAPYPADLENHSFFFWFTR